MAFGKYSHHVFFLTVCCWAGSCNNYSDGCYEQTFPIKELRIDLGMIDTTVFEMRRVDGSIHNMEVAVEIDTFYAYTDEFAGDGCYHYVQCYSIEYAFRNREMRIRLLQPGQTDKGDIEFTFGPDYYRPGFSDWIRTENDQILLQNDLLSARLHKDSGLTFLSYHNDFTLTRIH